MPRSVAGPHNIIVILKSITQEAYDALILSHNRGLVPPPTFILEDDGSPQDASRTPEQVWRETELTITLDDKPFRPDDGFVFGSNPEECSVLLDAHESGGGISRRHFAIDYNWHNGALFVQDVSAHGTTVESMTFGQIKLRGTSIPLETGDSIQAGLVQLSVMIPDRGEHAATFREKWEAFRDERDKALLRIGDRIVKQREVKTLLPTHELALAEKIGSGHTSEVYRAIDCKGDTYAVKVFIPAFVGTDKYVRTELDLARRLTHRHIVRFLAGKRIKSIPPETPFLVMEFCKEKTLYSKGFLTLGDTTKVIKQVLEAVAFLHSEGVAHRDLKPENILVVSWNPPLIKLCDFGITQHTDRLRTFCGTPMFVAPEVCYDTDFGLDRSQSKHITLNQDEETGVASIQVLEARYTPKADIWSVGIILFLYVREGDLPDDCPNIAQFHQAILSYLEKPVRQNWMSHLTLTKKMVQMNPADRPSAEQLHLEFLRLDQEIEGVEM